MGAWRPTTDVRIALHFHPDLPFGDETVLEALARDGVYRSQFETGTSNGGLSAHPGGDRWRWESRLFQGRYDDGPAADRPVYGAVRTDVYGGSVRFGSAHLRLRAEVTERATFCYPDSTFEPSGTTGPGGVDVLLEQAAADDVDELDRYVEAHVHGGVRLHRDVEALVLDPCFRDTAVHAAARRVAPIEWHPGFSVATDTLDPAYRGPEFVDLARRLGAVLTPDVIGAAARSGQHDPQSLKRVWHLLARFGQAARGLPGST